MSHQTFNFARTRHDKGFSLIEVLIALLVLAIGLLGLAALQAQGLRFNYDAYVRTQATNLAYDIVDRMRTNRASPLPLPPDRDRRPPTPAEVAANLAPYTAGPVPPFACDPTDSTIAMDLECWYGALAATLPAGGGAIAANATANFYDVTVRWLDRTPRDFGGTVRAPASAADCATIAGRFWDGTNCLVQQTWTVWP